MSENNKNESTVSFHVHHMIPKFSDYFPELEEYKEEEEYKVRLTVEGHACQHDILYRVFGQSGDLIASRMLSGQVSWVPGFTGYEHTEEWKENNSEMMKQIHAENPERREQMRDLGKRNHKRNPSPGCKASADRGRDYMRSHWRKEVWDALEEKWSKRRGFRWGKISLSRQFGVSVKTLDNMLNFIKSGKTWEDVTGVKL